MRAAGSSLVKAIGCRATHWVRLAAVMAIVVSLNGAAQAQAQAQAPQAHTLPPQIPTPVAQQTRQLLDWLGLLALLEQAPATLALGLDAEAKFRQAPPQKREGWRRELEPQLQPAQLQKALIQYVAERYQPATFKRAEELLQQPLAKRARFFDLAMTQASAVQGLKSYRTQLQTAPQAARRAIIQELDAATATSLLAAILQTGVAERVRRNADANETTAKSAADSGANPAANPEPQPATDTSGGASASSPEARASALTQEFVERQRFLAPLTEDYLLYAYRYLKDDELIALRDLMRDAELQWLLDVSRQGLVAVLRAPEGA